MRSERIYRKNPCIVDARYISEIHGMTLASLLATNTSVNTGYLRAYLTIGGSASSPTATLSPEENPVRACLVPLGELKEVVRDFVAVNVTKVIEAILYSVKAEGSAEMNTVEEGRDVLLNGVGLLLSDKDDEGVWLEDESGVAVSDKAVITKNDTNFIRASFTELPEPGAYRLVIATRDGGDASELGITRLVRKVIVK